MQENGFGTFFKITRGALLLRAVIYILLGVFMLFNPLTLITVVTVIIGVYFLFEGYVLFSGAKKTGGGVKAILYLNATIFTLLGLVTVLAPLIMDKLWMILAGIWLILGSMQYFTMPAKNKAARKGELITGVLSLLAGLTLIFIPMGLFAFIGILAGIMLIVSGIAVLGLSAAIDRG